MTSLHHSGGSGDGSGDSSGSGGGNTSSRCGAVQWGVSGGGQMQLQRRPRESLPPQQLLGSFWRWPGAASAASARDPYASATSQSVDVFALHYDAILTAMYALTIGSEGDCSLCVLPYLGIEAAALGASESALPGTAPAEALHTSHASGQVAPPCSCRLLSHHTLLWHHRLGHPSLPRLRGRNSRLLVSGLPRSLPPLPSSPTPPCLPCVEGWQRAAPHSSSFPPTTAPLQTLHMDVWVPARVSGQGREHYFLLVVDDYTRYTTVFPLHSKDQDLPVLRLHSNRGGEFSSDLLRDSYRGEGILQSFMLMDSPHQNGIAEHRIVRYAAHPLNLRLRVSLADKSPTLHWTREVGDASVFRVWGSRAFVRDTSADKLTAHAIPCVFHGFSPDAPGWQFYHPISRRVFPSQDVTFDESVSFYHLFPYRSAPHPPPPLFLAPGPPSFYHPTSRLVFPTQDVTFDESVLFYRLFPYRSTPPPLPPLFLAPGPPPVDPLLPQGPAPSGVFQGSKPGGAESEGAGSGGAEPGVAEPGGSEPAEVEPRGAKPEGVEPRGAESEGAESRGAESQCAASSGGPP
ncbi:unnamed protein product, partial [Closterium sp. NIES-53]